MVGNIKTDLAGRLNKYVDYRRNVSEKKVDSFTDTLQASQTPKESGDLHAKRRGGRTARGRSVMVASGAVQTSGGGSKLVTRLQAARLAEYAPIIQQAARKYSVPVELVCGVILQESGGRMNAVSHCGATGLMQLMPATARRLGVSNSFDPYQNIMGGTKYLRTLLDRFGGNFSLAVAGYNAGEGNVEKYGRRIPPFKETQAYVPNVLKYADTIWHLIRTPRMRTAAVDVGRVPTGAPAVQPTNIQHNTIYNVKRRV